MNDGTLFPIPLSGGSGIDINGDIDAITGKRCTFMAFPWRWDGDGCGVRVVAVNPGATETDRQVVRWKALAKEKFGDENRWRELTTGFPMGRLATLDEVGSTIVFLCSERSGYTSGCVVTIDGGASWRETPLPKDVQHIYALSCG